jgi:hypothetical protein
MATIISYFALDQLYGLGNVSDGPLSHTLIMPADIFYFCTDFDENILQYYCWQVCLPETIEKQSFSFTSFSQFFQIPICPFSSEWVKSSFGKVLV